MKYLLLILFMTFGINLNAQVAVNSDGSLPDSSAMLDVKTTSGGLLIPRMTVAQRNAIPVPATGLMVFVTDNNSFYFYDGITWNLIGPAVPANFSGITNYVIKFTGASSGGNSQIFDNSSNVGINTIIPVGKFHVKGNADVSQLIIDANTVQGNNNPLVKLRNSNGTDLMWLHSDHATNTFVGLNTGRVNNAVSGGTDNTFIGRDAGYSNTTGSENNAGGMSALYSNTTGSYNNANGWGALYSNTTGFNNSAVGWSALNDNTTGNFNTANGCAALAYNTTGYQNTATGSFALFNNTTGVANTATGMSALYSNTTGNSNTATGYYSLYSNSTGINNSANGYYTLYNNTTGSENSALGLNALYSNTTGNSNSAFGYHALSSNTTAGRNTALGWGALETQSYSSAGSSWSSNNVAVGYEALYSNQPTSTTNGVRNTAIGNYTLRSNTTGSYNTAGGYSALNDNTTGSYNTAGGYNALSANTIGSSNTAQGYNALNYNTTASQNTAVGRNALYSQSFPNAGVTWSSNNVAIGYEALYSNQPTSTSNGVNNTSVGNFSLRNNTTGDANTAHGYYALYSNSTGGANTAVGIYSSYFTNSSFNTSVGYSAGDNNTFSSGTFLGAMAYPNAGGYTNVSGLGYNARPTSSNQVRIGNSTVTSIGGYAGWTDFSDQRFKTAIQENVKGLEFIMKLRPVTYKLDINRLAANLKEDQRRDADGKTIMDSPSPSDIESRDEKSRVIHSGFLAQEVEAAAKSIGFEFSGVDAPKNENDYYGLRYSEFVVPLVKAVQEQQEEIEKLKKTNMDLEGKVELLLKRLEVHENKK